MKQFRWILAVLLVLGGFGQAFSQIWTITVDTMLVEDSGSTTEIQINNTAADGDPILSFELSGTAQFVMGVDDGDSDKFKIGTTAIGTGTWFTWDATDLTIGGGIISGDVDLNGNQLYLDADKDTYFEEQADDDIDLVFGGDTGNYITFRGNSTGSPNIEFNSSNSTTGWSTPYIKMSHPDGPNTSVSAAFIQMGGSRFSSLGDDAVCELFNNGSGWGLQMMIMVSSTSLQRWFGAVQANGSTTPVSIAENGTWGEGTGVPTGTSGADGSINVYNAASGRVYLENRSGGTITFGYFYWGL